MAITTLSGALSGMKRPFLITKTGVTMAAVGVAQRGYTPWYVGGIPGASTANAAGVNGAALTPASSAVEGRIIRTNPAGGEDAYLGGGTVTASQSGVLLVIDRLWHNSGLSVTSTSAQAISPATLPARDADGTTNGEKVYAAIEWSTGGGTGTPTVTLTYTDQSGNTGATSTFAAVASPPVGTFEMFGLAAGDSGIRAPTSFIQSGTRTSGVMHLVLFRIIAAIPIVTANVPAMIDVLTSGRPEILDDSVIQFVWLPSATTALNLSAVLNETQG